MSDEKWNCPEALDTRQDCPCNEYSADCYCICHRLECSHEQALGALREYWNL